MLLHGVGPTVVKCLEDHIHSGSVLLKVRLCDLPGFAGDDLHDVVFAGVFISVPVGIIAELCAKVHFPLLPFRGRAGFPDGRVGKLLRGRLAGQFGRWCCLSGSGNDGTDDISLLFKLLSGIGKVAIQHLDYAVRVSEFVVQFSELVVFFLDDLLLNLDGPANEVPINIFTFASLLFHVHQEGFVLLLPHSVVPKVFEGFYQLWVKGSFGVIIISIVLCLE